MKSKARLQCASLVLALIAALASVGQCLLTDSQKTVALDTINHLRRCTRPKAANMNAISWDTDLEALAQKAADNCVFTHYYTGEYANKGEVVYQGGSTDCEHILNFMYLEREGYDLASGKCNPVKYKMFSTCGHYEQLVTAAVTKVGCAHQSCSGTNLFFCEFNRGVNYPPYERGPWGTKCGISLAAYHFQGLCYYEAPTNADCRLNCLNYSYRSITDPCQCKCLTGFSGFRCEKKINNLANIPNDCQAQGVVCQNGGTPTLFDTVCKCVCQPNFQGESCEVNIEQTANSLIICFGGIAIYQSYRPMPESVCSNDLRTKIRDTLVKEVNNYCRASYSACCPNSIEVVDPFVASSDCLDLANYPEQQIDGTLCIALFIKLNSGLATKCWGKDNAYLPTTVLKEAYKRAEASIKEIVSSVGITFVKTL